MNGDWIDISVPLRNGMVNWPGTIEFRSQRISDVDRGDLYSISSLELHTHTGTHMDAPCHFIPGTTGIDTLPFDATIGPARLLLIEAVDVIGPEELEAFRIERGERIIIKTRNSETDWPARPFNEDYVHLTLKGAVYLAEAGTRCVGIDYLSVAAFVDKIAETHRALLEAGVWIIEGLDLSGVEPGDYEMVCLPLRIEGADGSPCRALLRPIGS